MGTPTSSTGPRLGGALASLGSGQRLLVGDRARRGTRSLPALCCHEKSCAFAEAALTLSEARLVYVADPGVEIVELMPRLQDIVDNPPMDTKPPRRHPITCEFDGKTHKGTYWVAGKILTVSTGRGGNSKQVGTTEPEALAKQLLLELVKAGKV